MLKKYLTLKNFRYMLFGLFSIACVYAIGGLLLEAFQGKVKWDEVPFFIGMLLLSYAVVAGIIYALGILISRVVTNGTNAAKGFLFLVISMVVVGVFVSYESTQKANEAAQREAARRARLTPEKRAAEEKLDAELALASQHLANARHLCNEALMRALNDPYSAKLEPTNQWAGKINKDGTILVQPNGRAKNAFGAYVHGIWNCVVKPTSDSKYQVISFEQISP